MTVLFGIITFICMIVFYGQAAAISRLGRIDKEDMDEACSTLNG